MNKKLTSEDIEGFEADNLIDAIGNGIELNNEFLEHYCSEDFTALLKQIPENDREYILSGISEKHWWNGSPACKDTQDIWIDQPEIEWQFEDKPEDVFENPSDFTIDGDLAYLYTGYGLSIEYDRAELTAAVKSYLE
jgi:hypothetical protein